MIAHGASDDGDGAVERLNASLERPKAHKNALIICRAGMANLSMLVEVLAGSEASRRDISHSIYESTV